MARQQYLQKRKVRVRRPRGSNGTTRTMPSIKPFAGPKRAGIRAAQPRARTLFDLYDASSDPNFLLSLTANWSYRRMVDVS